METAIQEDLELVEAEAFVSGLLRSLAESLPTPWEIERERGSIRHAKYYSRHRERLRAKSRANQAYNTRFSFLWALKNKYKISLQDYEDMLVAQSGRCKLCGDNPKSLHIDHDHKTWRVRGLLCGTCNRALGCAKDNPSLLRAMALYLEET